MPDSENKNFWDGFLGSYQEHLVKQGRPHISVLTYLNPIRKLITFAEDKGVTKPKQITAELLREFQQLYLEKRDFKESTIKNYILFIRLFFDFLISSGVTKENPANNLELISKPQAPDKQLAHFYTCEEILRRYVSDQRGWVSFSYAHQLDKHLNGFFKYLVANEIKSVYSVSEAVLLKYREYLWEEFVQVKANSLVVQSQIERLRCVARLFRYLYKEGISHQ